MRILQMPEWLSNSGLFIFGLTLIFGLKALLELIDQKIL